MTRTCKLDGCSKKLSMYNENEYCFAHLAEGCKIDSRQEETRKYNIHQKHLKKMKKLKEAKC